MTEVRFPNIGDYYLQPGLAEKEERGWLSQGLYKKYWEIVQAAWEAISPGYRPKKVLELGCGSGLLASLLPSEVDYLGVDINKRFLEMAEARNPTRRFAQEDVRGLTIGKLRAKHGFRADFVMAFAFLKHFPLDSWNETFQQLLILAPYSLFQLQVTPMGDVDDGVEFHHVSVEHARIDHCIGRAQREVLAVWTTFEGTLGDGKTLMRENTYLFQESVEGPEAKEVSLDEQMSEPSTDSDESTP